MNDRLHHLLHDHFTLVIASEKHRWTFRISKALFLFFNIVLTFAVIMASYSLIIRPYQEERRLKMEADSYRHIKLMREMKDVLDDNKDLSGQLAVKNTKMMNYFEELPDNKYQELTSSRKFAHMKAYDFYFYMNRYFKSDERVTMLTSMPYGSPATGGYISGFEYRFLFGIWQHHDGVDITNPYPVPIYSTMNGRVVNAGWGAWPYFSGFGICVVVDNGFYQVIYGHMQRVYVNYGDVVHRGTLLGQMGNTGTSVGQHVHYEIRIPYPINPDEFDLTCVKGDFCQNSFKK